MRPQLLAFLLVILASTSAFADITFEPGAPTSRTAVNLRVRDYWPTACTPMKAVVTRQDTTIDIRWTSDCDEPALAPWWYDVHIGVLPAGVYTVRLLVNESIFQNRTLVVSDATASLLVQPPYASTRGGTRIHIFPTQGCLPLALNGATVLIDGVEVPSTIEGCQLTVSAPAHAAGPVNLTVRKTDEILEAPFELRYLDPAAPADPSVFERVLIPILYNGPGAYGSQWVTETHLEASLLAFDWFHDFERAACKTECSSPALISDFRDHPAGLIVTVPRRESEYVKFSMRIRDTSRSDHSWGTEVPIVREADMRHELVFKDVPFDPRYRLTLRLYSMRGDTRMWAVRATPEDYQTVRLTGPCATAPCASTQPSFVTYDLNQLFPALSGTGPRQLRVGDGTVDLKWGFITATNNETQEVTVISPMR